MIISRKSQGDDMKPQRNTFRPIRDFNNLLFATWDSHPMLSHAVPSALKKRHHQSLRHEPVFPKGFNPKKINHVECPTYEQILDATKAIAKTIKNIAPYL